MDTIIDSVLFRNINKKKLVGFYNKYKETKMSEDILKSLTDKDEFIFCYYFSKYQQNIEVMKLDDFFSSLMIE